MLAGRDFGEANRWYFLLTPDFGLIVARAQGVRVHGEDAGGAELTFDAAMATRQSAFDMTAHGVFQRNIGARSCHHRPARRERHHPEGTGHVEGAAVAQDGGAFDHRRQLAHVAGPG